MKRQSFLKKSILGFASVSIISNFIKAESPNSYSLQAVNKQVGFNHLPNKENTTMKSILHKSNSRGVVDHGWLKSKHSFSFANYYNPDRVHFGALRVLNDDCVSGGKGFGTHPHKNMEIISIPLEGDLEHKDSMGNHGIIKEGDVQVMSAGSGIKHSEYNKNADREVMFLQIWIIPNKENVTPRYDQITLNTNQPKNKLTQILSPNADDEGVWIHQNAWFHLADLDKGEKLIYNFKNKNNGVYAFILDGDVTINEQELNKRDGYGVWDLTKIDIASTSKARLLLIEVPMG